LACAGAETLSIKPVHVRAANAIVATTRFTRCISHLLNRRRYASPVYVRLIPGRMRSRVRRPIRLIAGFVST